MPEVPVVGMVLFATLIWLFTDYLKAITNGDWKAVLTQTVAWAAGIAATFLISASDYGNTVINGIRLDDTDGVTKLLVGLLGSSLAGGLVKVTRSLDKTDSNAQPSLVPPKKP